MLLSARKAGAFGSRTGESAVLVEGEDGAPTVEPELETEEMEEWRGTGERLERKLCGATSASGEATTLSEFLLTRLLRERKLVGKGIW